MIRNRVSAAPLHVAVRRVESRRTVIAACLLRRYSRAVRKHRRLRAAPWRLLSRMQRRALPRRRLGAAASSRRDVRYTSVLFALAGSSHDLVIAGLTPRLTGRGIQY
jgi:hypothetical protein